MRDIRNVVREIGILLVFGAVAAVLQAYTREPINIPGHAWIVWMVMLTAGRFSSPFRWAGSVMGVGAGVLSSMPLLDASLPRFAVILFIIPAFLFDIVYRYARMVHFRNISTILTSGFILFSLALIQFSVYYAAGTKFGAVAKFGLQYVALLYAIFGLIGGLIGMIALKVVHHRSETLTAN